MNIFNKLRNDIISAGRKICNNDDVLQLAAVEIPKDKFNGDLSSNIAMIVAAKQNVKPKDLAIRFKEILTSLPYIASIEVAGPGFINFTIKADMWHNSINDILLDKVF